MNRWLSPALLVILLSAIGGALLYVLGRWDESIDTRWELHRAAVDRALEDAHRARAREDSLRSLQLMAHARADSAERLAGVQVSAIAELEAEVERENEISVTSSIAEILPKLHLHPIDDNLFGTDSSGVRFLEGLRRDSFRALLVSPLQEHVRTLGQEKDALREALWLANERADSAGARALQLEGLLRENQKLTSCHLDPFGLVPCPRRGLTFVAGVALGVVGFSVARGY